jgi:hypothetical protein
MRAIHAMPCFVAYISRDGTEKNEYKTMSITNPLGYISPDNR